ncbi:MAG: signal peptidase I [Chloroflexota bacterium]
MAKGKKRSFGRELLETAILTLAIFLAVRVALQNFKVEGMSMSPNLQNNEYILVNKVDYMLHPPSRGDIVVFKAVPAGQPDKDFIKRVIGLPGDTVAVRNDHVYVNGKQLTEPYINAAHRPLYTWGPKQVPKGDYFVLGDNRNDSDDSHLWTISPWLPRSDIIGKAWVAYWPPHDLHVFQASPSIHLSASL